MNRTETSATAQIYNREEAEAPFPGACMDVLPPPATARHASLRRVTSLHVCSQECRLPGTPDFPAPRCSWSLTHASLSGLWISAGRCNPTSLALALFSSSQLTVLCNPACNHLMAKPRMLSVPSSSKAKELASSCMSCSHVSPGHTARPASCCCTPVSS